MKRKFACDLDKTIDGNSWWIEILPRISIYSDGCFIDGVKCKDYYLQFNWLFWSITFINSYDVEAIFER